MIGRVVLVTNNFPIMVERMPKAVRKIVWRTANKVRTRMINSMSGPKHGRTYRRNAITRKYSSKGKRGKQYADAGFKTSQTADQIIVTVGYRYHRASAPGEAPAVDLGNLKGSISAEMTGETTAVVGVSAEYGIPLEYGTRKIAKRPFARPAVEQEEGDFIAAMKNLENDLK
jgi:HK97 gp10 family phage protein